MKTGKLSSAINEKHTSEINDGKINWNWIMKTNELGVILLNRVI